MSDSFDRVECLCEIGEYERAGRIYLVKAGECFSLAGKHELAAQLYASINYFRECLSACTKGNHLDLGLHCIDKWKQQKQLQAQPNYTSSVIIMEEFLENSARECYKAKDNASLMKFVRALCSKESKRKLLKSLDCLEELLVLEEEWGENYNESSERDTLLEIDLLEKAGQFENSCLLIFSYVISNALWGSGNQGWPLKSFPLKAELLNRAMSAAEMVSETFHASICAQAKFLLYEQKNLSELMQFYNTSKTPIVEILVVRKLLDVHFEVNVDEYEWDRDLHLDAASFYQRIVRNQFSVGALVYLWNLWKECSLEILQCLENLELDGLCLSYFGLMRLPAADNLCVTFHLLNPDAAWARDVNRNIEARHVASAARKFWLQELVGVGLRVLDALQQLHKSSIAKRLPVYCQSMCLLHIFDIAKFFLDSNSINMACEDNGKMQDCVQLSTKYFEFVFPFDPQMSLSENMISLRETEISRNLLEESVLRYISGSRELSCKQIGQVVMTMMGSGKLKHGLYDKIGERLSNDSPWKPFIENLKGFMESDSPLEALSQDLFKALVETDKLRWRVRDFMSPNCFLYLVERLMLLVPKPGGNFFTMKSSFLEYFMCLPLDSNPRTSFMMNNAPLRGELSKFVAQVVVQCLSSNNGTRQWIEKSGIDCNSYLRVLLLRVMMIVCVMDLNGEFPKYVLDQLLATHHITSQLPKEFYEALTPKKKQSYFSAVSTIASAFKVIGDPLVLVMSSDGDGIHTLQPHACSDDVSIIRLRSFSCNADVIKTLSASNDQRSSNLQGEIKSNSTSQQIKWDLIGELSEAYFNSEDMHSILLRKKVEVTELVNSIKTAVARLNEVRGEDKVLIEDLNTLVSLFTTTREDDLEGVQREMGEVLKRLVARRPRVDSLLDDPQAVTHHQKGKQNSKKKNKHKKGKGGPKPIY